MRKKVLLVQVYKEQKQFIVPPMSILLLFVPGGGI